MAVYKFRKGNGKQNEADLQVKSAEEMRREARCQMIQMLIPVALVFFQPDFGSAMVLLFL